MDLEQVVVQQMSVARPLDFAVPVQIIVLLRIVNFGTDHRVMRTEYPLEGILLPSLVEKLDQ